MGGLYFGHVEISPEMARKIQSKHGITPDEVRELCDSNGLAARWHKHPEHGLRLLVRGTTRHGRRLLVILQPVDVPDGHWRLAPHLSREGVEGIMNGMTQPDEFAEVDTTEPEFEAMWEQAAPATGSRARRSGSYWTLETMSGAVVTGAHVARQFSMTSRTQLPLAETHS